MKMRQSTYFVIATLIFAAGTIFYSFTYPYLESWLLPVIIAAIVLILAAFQLAKELRTAGEDSAQEEASEKKHAYALSECWPSAAWICGFCLALYLVGFLITIPLFVFSYIKSRGRGWVSSIAVPIVMTLSIYLIFTTFLKLDLHPGLFFE